MAKKKDNSGDWREHVEPLFDKPKTPPRPRRAQLRVERAVGDAISAGQKSGAVDAKLDAGLAALARELGRAADVAGEKRDPYAAAAASRELREVLGKLGLTPAARNATPTDELAAALAALATPSRPDEPAAS